jgi:hypothetical protein
MDAGCSATVHFYRRTVFAQRNLHRKQKAYLCPVRFFPKPYVFRDKITNALELLRPAYLSWHTAIISLYNINWLVFIA